MPEVWAAVSRARNRLEPAHHWLLSPAELHLYPGSTAFAWHVAGVPQLGHDAFEEWAAGRFLDLRWSAGGGYSSAAENPLYQVKARPRVVVTAGKWPRLLLWVGGGSSNIGGLS